MDNIAINGYDLVAYFTEGKATLGKAEFSVNHDNHQWLFSSKENRDAFENNPKHYHLVHNGSCSLAASLGKTGNAAPQGSPQKWMVNDQQLYLFSNGVARYLWKLFFAPAGKLKRWVALFLISILLLSGALFAFGKTEVPSTEQLQAISTNANEWISPVDISEQGFAIAGYDPVAYFTQGEPAKGSTQWRTEWNGATWLFANQEHMLQFNMNPDQYAPQFGGHCAFASSIGKKVPGSPLHWSVVDDRLFLTANAAANALLRMVPNAGYSAYTNWPELRSME